jgi:hypothetical protein
LAGLSYAARDRDVRGHPEGFERAILLNWSHARAVGLDAGADLDLSCRAARLDAQCDGGEAYDDSFTSDKLRWKK